MNFNRVKIITTIPPENADELRQALGEAGAGKIGDYTFCSFSLRGRGYSKPGEDADPHIGEPGELTVIEEEQVEVTCSRAQAKRAIAALKQVHPYEEPVIEIIPLLSEDDL